jgi:sporulation protein YlmC with PRC-barrel domain
MTAAREIRLERLLGRLLVDAFGHSVGTIEDVVAEPDGEDYLVTHVVVGPHAPLARALAFGHKIPVLDALGLGRSPRVRRLPWEWLDLADPDRPRLRPSVAEGDWRRVVPTRPAPPAPRDTE